MLISKNNRVVRIRRVHGLGNVLMLLPILKNLTELGNEIVLYTKRDFVEILSGVTDWLNISEDKGQLVDYDLDHWTEGRQLQGNRTAEFAELFSLKKHSGKCKLKFHPSSITRFVIPKDFALIAVESTHRARELPKIEFEKLVQLDLKLQKVIVGCKTGKQPKKCIDLRGKTDLLDVAELISIAKVVISVDSGIMHLACSIGKPTVAIFGGINPLYRITGYNQIIALRKSISCSPCNKHEICNSQYWCLQNFPIEVVSESVNTVCKMPKNTPPLVVNC